MHVNWGYRKYCIRAAGNVIRDIFLAVLDALSVGALLLSCIVAPWRLLSVASGCYSVVTGGAPSDDDDASRDKSSTGAVNSGTDDAEGRKSKGLEEV